MINGIINLYKEQGFTSHDAVARMRRILGQKKIGHTGTLDPDATGVLPLCLGRATRVAGMLTAEKKRYDATLLLGRSTDTQDAGGKTLFALPEDALRARLAEAGAEDGIKEVIASFLEAREQIPPMYAAIRHEGRHLYELAREGISVERKPRPVRFYEIEVQEIALPRVRFSVLCSRGTYIRTLCHDIGETLAVGGCMERLVRTQVGPFLLADAKSLREVEEAAAEGRLLEWITPVDRLFLEHPARVLRAEAERYAYNGCQLTPENFTQLSERDTDVCAASGTCRVYDAGGAFVGLYRVSKENGMLIPKKLFFDPEEAAARIKRG